MSGGDFHPSRLWDVATGNELCQFLLPGENYAGFFGDLSADGKTLATAFEGNEVIFMDAATGKRVNGKALAGRAPGKTNALRFVPDGRSVASISGDWLRFWDVAMARETRRLKLPNASDSVIDHMKMIGAQVAFAADGKLIAASSQRDGTIFLIDAASGAETARLEGTNESYAERARDYSF